LRFIGFTREEMAGMTDTERWRKAFSAVAIVEEMVSSLVSGDETATSPAASSAGMPDLNVPRGVDPMAAYGPTSTEL